MKLNKIFIYGILLAAASLTACEDEVMIGKANNPNLSVPGEVVYVTDPDGKRLFTHIDLRDTKDIPLYVNTPKALKRDCNIAFVYDETVLAEYNAANGTSYEAVPKSMVSLTNDGITRLEAGNTISQPMTVTVTSAARFSQQRRNRTHQKQLVSLDFCPRPHWSARCYKNRAQGWRGSSGCTHYDVYGGERHEPAGSYILHT